ncbi:hypothetical protein DFP72DRAFT_388034 [Ephemerocybe angulata]|uniref:Uncharacterized protein n=1 Tax=Ephemerocybe angulata TaxID=980116 RepID=A0A8H6M7E5_9AGAR|nr:hypothetical protein DFP72DRAFT_388034 [Tulosesus angulatus]
MRWHVLGVTLTPLHLLLLLLIAVAVSAPYTLALPISPPPSSPGPQSSILPRAPIKFSHWVTGFAAGVRPHRTAPPSPKPPIHPSIQMNNRLPPHFLPSVLSSIPIPTAPVDPYVLSSIACM